MLLLWGVNVYLSAVCMFLPFVLVVARYASVAVSCMYAVVSCMCCQLYIESSQPEWCISSMIYSRGTPFWPEILDMCC